MLHAHLTAMEREHQRLEDLIRAEYAAHNDKAVQQLKVEKLYLKEEIARLREEIEAGKETIH